MGKDAEGTCPSPGSIISEMTSLARWRSALSVAAVLRKNHTTKVHTFSTNLIQHHKSGVCRFFFFFLSCSVFGLGSSFAHYIIPDTPVLTDYLEIMEQPPVQGVILLQTPLSHVSTVKRTSIH